MKRSSVAVLMSVLLALSLLAPPALLAQEDAPVLIRVNLVQVKPEMIDRFRELHRDVFLPAGKKSGAAFRTTAETVYGKSFEMAVATPLESYAQLDEPFGGLSPNEIALAGELWNHCVDSRRSFVVQARPDLSMEAQPAADLSRRIRIVVASGKTGEFEALWTREILPALEKSGAKGYQVFQTVLGGNNAEYWGVMPLANFAMLDSWSAFSGLSAEDAAKLNAKTAALIETLEIDVTRLDRELSYGLPGME